MEAIPVVMVTTEGSEKIVDKCMAIGAKGYIKKPFMPEDIRRTLNTIMGETGDGSTAFNENNEGCDF